MWMKGLTKVFSDGLAILKEWGIVKMVYVGERVGSHLVGRRWKKWSDSVNDWLKKRGLNFGQARGVVYDGNEWRGFVMENSWGVARGMKP